jgi:hypothetical protein
MVCLRLEHRCPQSYEKKSQGQENYCPHACFTADGEPTLRPFSFDFSGPQIIENSLPGRTTEREAGGRRGINAEKSRFHKVTHAEHKNDTTLVK